MNFWTNDGVKIYYHTYGSPWHQPVVFLTGFSGSEVTWTLQISHFVTAGFYVITYDHRGHGKSDKVPYGLTAHRLAQDLQNLIAYLNLDKIILIGHSMGAAVLNAYEELFTDDQLAAVVTEDQSPVLLKKEGWLQGQGLSLGEVPHFIEDFSRIHLTKKEIPVDLKRELGQGMSHFNFKVYYDLLLNVLVQDWRQNISREKVPHLFLAGGLSPIFPPEHAEAARQLQGNSLSQSRIFADCGHILHLEAPNDFNHLVVEWLKNVVIS